MKVLKYILFIHILLKGVYQIVKISNEFEKKLTSFKRPSLLTQVLDKEENYYEST